MSMPGEELNSRPLHIIWIVSCSSSMAGSKIQSLNTAIREAIPAMLQAAQSNPNAQVFVRAIKFSSGAQWHIAQETPVENFQWQDVQAGGASDMGKALSMVAEALKMPPMPERGLPPVLVLITDCYPSDDAEQGIRAIMAQPWGQKAVRLCMGIGDDADYSILEKFIGNAEIPALRAHNAEDLVNYIRWASTEVVKVASAPSFDIVALPTVQISTIQTSDSSKENQHMSMPGGQISTRPLQFFWIADCSGSMAGSKIQSLNTAIREAIPAMLQAAQSNPNAQVFVRAIKFSSGATWHIAQETPVENFQWQDLSAGGVTDMGKALKMVADQLKMPPMKSRGLPPVLILITDGYPTDDVNSGIKAILDEPWGKRSVRLGIGIGDDADYSILDKFIGNAEIPALRAHNAEDLVNYIKWVSTEAVKAASAPAVSNDPAASSGPMLPTIPTPPPSSGQTPNIW